jgi:hypothetical protein
LTNKKEVQKRADKKRVGIRSRSWTCEVYPTEGNPPAPSNWRDIIDEERIQWVESPLHDKDVNPDNTPKRAHIHILLMFDSVKNFKQVEDITKKINGPIPQICHSVRGLVRYFCHLDNPDKYQYNPEKIIPHNGAEIRKYLIGENHKYDVIKEMMTYVDKHSIIEYADLLKYASDNEVEWFRALCDNSSYVMSMYVKSCRHKFEVGIDPQTGEVST